MGTASIMGTAIKEKKRKNQRIARTADAPEQWGKTDIVTCVVGEFINGEE